jgi:DNA-binding transcriptional LysR family regulator
MTNDLEIRHCRVLVAVADHGSISSAARALGLAQSTISETLLSLERLVGVPLTVRRNGQEATLTAPALAMLPHARSLVATAEAVVAMVSPGRAGAIRLGAVESASTFLLPRAMTAFRRHWPLVDVQVTIGLCADLRRRVQQGELDLAITVERPPDSPGGDGAHSRVLSPAEICLFVSPPHAAGLHGNARHALSRCRFLLPDPDGSLHALMREWFAPAGGQPRLESAGSIEGVKAGVRSGGHVGVLPRYAVARELESGEFVAVQAAEPLPAIALGLTTRCQPLESTPLHAMSLCIEESSGTLGHRAVAATEALRGQATRTGTARVSDASGTRRRRPAPRSGHRS